MIRLLFWLGLAVLLFFALRSKFKLPASKKSDVKLAEPEAMLRCAHCGVHFPESEAVSQGDAVFCSEDHRQKHFPAP